ncbi:MAG: cupin domain-containing protein [Chloroflexi bacterium]|nr:cupin domain-containing protein [Chloroflexota bacterium]
MRHPIHPKAPEVAGASIEEILDRYSARFADRAADWDAFADARVEGYRRAQRRYIGAGGSGKHDDPSVVPPRAFTLSVMYVEPDQGNAAHTHEVEEVFFVLTGQLTVFLEDESGQRVDIHLGAWDCISCPPGVIHGYINEGPEPVSFQVLLGTARPELMGYADAELLRERDAHLTQPRQA